ncbi:MAG: 2-amino-4-hydroxy-6-hydroxymethyldihydropteridine diphosphokinase [Prevotella sp.]|nr:2-amino-4-hydroxy-6-hydroxymethyldihydropteridine diphosphokinase [Prevotella sp.]
MHRVYLGLGSNMGDRRQNIEKAVALIGKRVGEVVRQSSLMETEPWGFASDNLFLNGVILCQTELSPREVLQATQKIERELGRRKKKSPLQLPQKGEREVLMSYSPLSTRRGVGGEAPNYQDRPIDIDILLYDDLNIDEPDLKIPHPLMHERDFVMIPLREIQSPDSP